MAVNTMKEIQEKTIYCLLKHRNSALANPNKSTLALILKAYIGIIYGI